MADLPCPTCGSPLTFIDPYQRFYCHRCLAYAPEGYGDHGAQTCPTCGGILSYVRQYGRMYCYRCNAYPAEPPATATKAETPSETQAPSTSDASAGAATPSSAPTASLSPAQPSESAPVVVPAVPTEETPHEPASEPQAESGKGEPESPQETPSPAPEPSPSEPSAAAAVPSKPEEAAPPPPSMEMRILAASKPAAIRVKLFALKKPELTDLCRIYNLDTTGTKEEIQQRLLAYLHALESEGEPQEPETPLQEAPASAAAEAVTPPTLLRAEGPQPAMTGSGSAQVASAAVVQETRPQPTPVAAPIPVVVAPAPAPAEAPHVATKAEHPCPTCGRELTFIAQYNRWYCYYCQRYAPAAARSRNACPTCGATMRWIDQHHRWWCDACQKYASADLPSPAGSAAAAAAVEQEVAVSRTIAVHRHGTPAGGAGLVGFGIALYIVYAFFAYLGAMMGIVTPSSITPEMLYLLQFFAFLFVAIGAIAGLYGMRDRS